MRCATASPRLEAQASTSCEKIEPAPRLLPRWFKRFPRIHSLHSDTNRGGAPLRAPTGVTAASCGKGHLPPSWPLIYCILLPFLCLFLLPTIRFEKKNHQLCWPENDSTQTRLAALPGSSHETTTSFAHILAAFLRLPLDRVRLQSGMALALAATMPLALAGSKSDLQEEEQMHVMLLAPAEQRNSYAATAALSSNPVTAAPQQHAAYVDAQADESGANGAVPRMASDRYGPSADESALGTGGAEHSGALVAAEGTTSSSAMQTRSDLPVVRAVNVKCEKNHMTVNIVFDRPFYGMVFSKGHYNDQKCVHLPPNSGQTSVNFDIHLGKCGMSSSDATGQQHQSLQHSSQQPNGVFIENTIIIQYDPLVQEIYDQARKLRCTWYDYYEKQVTFRPYNVDMLDAVTANFLGDNIQCWMQIQVGKGPWSSEVAGIVKIGQTMTMVLAIKDDENRFDMLVRNCVAHDGKHAPIQLVDEYGCVARPKIMSKFQKVRNFGPAATVVSYAHFQAFKFPDSMSVHFQCVIQVCRYECPEPVCGGPLAAGGGGGGSELGGVTSPGVSVGSSTVQQPPSDYAASGTEMIAAKEPLPVGYHAHPSYNHSHSLHQLKLDEAQGRVQVRLDTSMMAALRPASQQQQAQAQLAPGPLPPHLLHMATNEQQQARGVQTATNAAYSSYGPTQAAAPPASIGRPASAAPPIGGQQSHQALHYSVPYPQQMAAAASARRSSQFAHRMSELPADEGGETHQREQHQGLAGAPYEHPLSLIAAPRGLSSGSPTGNAIEQLARHRLRRSLNASSVEGALAHMKSIDALRQHSKRHLGPGSSSQPSTTSVQTQRTIQVVSPDDVAFSLMGVDPEEAQLLAEGRASSDGRRVQSMAPGSGVCFSTTRFLWGAFVTLGALVSGIVAVTFVILRQRAQLERKLSTVYDPTAVVQLGVARNGAVSRQQQQQQAANLDHVYRRQQDEIQQRNNYLARLYSQFAPASYWR